MKKTEIKRLQEKYLVNGKFAIKYSPFCKFEQSLLFQLWNKIEEFERPDMIAFDMNNLINTYVLKFYDVFLYLT